MLISTWGIKINKVINVCAEGICISRRCTSRRVLRRETFRESNQSTPKETKLRAPRSFRLHEKKKKNLHPAQKIMQMKVQFSTQRLGDINQSQTGRQRWEQSQHSSARLKPTQLSVSELNLLYCYKAVWVYWSCWRELRFMNIIS